MKKLLPVILAVIGLAAGTGAGMVLKPAGPGEPEDGAQAPGETPGANAEGDGGAPAVRPEGAGMAGSGGQAPDAQAGKGGVEYVKLNNQFVVPVVSGSRVAALIVMSLSIEVAAGQKEAVFSREPKLRDAFLRVLFDHANSGGFDGAFTAGEKMNDLRGSLAEAARRILGPIASDVLVIDIVRQDV